MDPRRMNFLYLNKALVLLPALIVSKNHEHNTFYRKIMSSNETTKKLTLAVLLSI